VELIRTELTGTRRLIAELVVGARASGAVAGINDPEAASSALFALGHGLAHSRITAM
jgi:hypothetical protein